MKQLLKRMVQKYLKEEEQKLLAENHQKKYKKSGLTYQQAIEIREKIKQAFEGNKLYRKNDLSLDELAKHIDYNRYKVSEVINTYFSKNYYTLLNHYRIEEAKELLASDTYLSVKAIMYEVGFNSKNSFYSAFKKHTGLSPNDYRNLAVYDTRPSSQLEVI